MSGLYSALVSMAATQVAWSAKIGAALGLLAGGALAYAAIARVLREHGQAPRRLGVRRYAAMCCLLWGLTLPLCWGTAGLLWGLAHGLGNVVEGPISTMVRDTTHTWLSRATALRNSGVLGRFALTKRLTEGELAAVVQAAPTWLGEILDRDEAGAPAARTINGVHVPPQVLAFLREEMHRLTGDHDAFLRQEVERLRNRAQGAAANRPTLQETIEAMVAPAVFEDAATTIRARAAHYERLLVFSALGLAVLLAGALRLAWKRG